MNEFSCPCLNLKVYLANPWREVKDLKTSDAAWLELKKWHKIGRGEWNVVAGTKIEFPALAKFTEYNAKVGKATQPWVVASCENCNVELYAFCKAKPSILFFNLNIRPLTRDNKKASFSKAFQIVVQESDEAQNTLLECPEETERESFDAYQTLEKRIESCMEEETKSMEARIEAFIAEQQEQLKQFLTKTYQERKILWHKMCQSKRWSIPQSPRRNSTSESKPETPTVFRKNIVIFDEYESSLAPISSSPIAQINPPAAIPQIRFDERFEKDFQKVGEIFALDEDGDKKSEFSESEDTRSETSEAPLTDDDVPTKVFEPSEFLVSKSVPMQIPAMLLSPQPSMKKTEPPQPAPAVPSGDQPDSKSDEENDPEPKPDEKKDLPVDQVNKIIRMNTYRPAPSLSYRKSPHNSSSNYISKRIPKDREVLLSSGCHQPSDAELSKSFDVPSSMSRSFLLRNNFL